ncbi:MAG: MotA/TolQ/ExbB proton channel family protein, partial [Planctomycetes bacterium]|nr:MotA/TolQ/ExbB proton channel family protein [Planctomycetota bacterium]
MDIASLLGIVSGTGLVLISIMMGGPLDIFIHIPSLMVTLGGTIASTLINYPLNKVMSVFRVSKNVFLFKLPSFAEIIKEIVDFSVISRREGLLALENKLENLDDPFMAKGIRLIIDGFPTETVRDILEIDADQTAQRHATGKSILDAMGAAAPAFGMIGTLIGLVQMLQTMDDPSSIGPAMAVALLTTFYGAVLANIIFIPLAGKLKNRSQAEVLSKTLITEGMESILAGENPRIMEQKLHT